MSNIKLNTAAILKALNLTLIAVHGIKDGACTCYKGKECTSAGKHPVHNDWKNHPIESTEILSRILQQKPDMNLGVVTGNGLIVVDIDPKNGGMESFKNIEHLFNPTFKVVTGSGGYHFYYYLPAAYNKPVGNKVNVIKGIDVRSDGGFVVAPSSLHKSANYYKIAEDSLNEIQVIGAELLNLITKEKDYNSTAQPQNNLKKTGYIGEGSRNDAMTGLIGAMFRRGIPYSAVLEGARALNLRIFNPPLPDEEVERIVKSISKYKNNEQQDLSEDKLETPAGKVRALLHNSKLNANKKNEQISNLIIEDLCQQGKFYKALGDYFYFNCETKKLISIHVENINYKSLLAQYGINASTSFYNYISQGIAVHCEVEGEETQVFKYARYDAENNRVYLKNKEGMYKITPDAVSCCDNGTDGVLFSDLIDVDDYKFIEDLDDQDYIEQFITTLGNYDAAYMSTETQKLLVKCYFVSLFMPEFLSTKPLLVVVGTKGSAKTTLLKAFVKCLYGAKHSVTAMVNKADDLDVTVINSHFAAIDNLDTYKEWLSDKLAVYATGGYIKKRKLYTDAQMYESFIDSFIGITTRTLGFKRDDVMQRLILVFLESIKTGYKAESDLLNPILDNREKILSQAIQSVQNVLKSISGGKYKNFKSNFRMSDFARFMTMFLDNHAEAEKHLAILTKMQHSTALENDILMPYLAKYVEDCCSTTPCYASAYDIYQILEGYAALSATNTLFKNEFTQSYDKVVSFAKRLNNIKDDISEYIIIETKRIGGNQTLYLLSKGERFDELPQKNILRLD